MATTEAGAKIARFRSLDRWSLVAAAAAGLAAALLAGLLIRLVTERGGTNSYALLADAFLNGRFDSPSCFDIDCIRFMEKIYVVFPPVPAALVTPLVALFGPGTTGFMAVALALFAITGLCWWAIADRLGVVGEARMWTTLAFLFGTPAIYVALRGDAVWFFAQGVALALTSGAILAALDRRLALAGALIGLAFLSRQMALFAAPFLFALSRPKGARLIAFDRATILDAIKLAAPLLAAIAVYCLYNWLRFGEPLETGYKYIADFPENPGWINWRIGEVGLFSPDYFVFNAFHLFLQGFHVEFAGRHMTDLVRLDPMGTSIVAASPFLLYAFYARRDMRLLVGGLGIAVVTGITLFYHSNGYSQHNVQRYALDWLPVLYVLMLPAFAVEGVRLEERLKPFKLLVTYAIALNVAAFAIVAVTKGAM